MKVKHSKFTREAIKAAKKSTFRQRLGAVVVHSGKVVGKGFNYAHGTGQFYIDGLHAEISALNNTLARYRYNSTLYVVRLGKDNSMAYSKPCKPCISIVKKMGVKQVWYIDENKKWNRIRCK